MITVLFSAVFDVRLLDPPLNSTLDHSVPTNHISWKHIKYKKKEALAIVIKEHFVRTIKCRLGLYVASTIYRVD